MRGLNLVIGRWRDAISLEIALMGSYLFGVVAAILAYAVGTAIWLHIRQSEWFRLRQRRAQAKRRRKRQS